MSTDVVTELDWTITVVTIPTRIPSIGLASSERVMMLSSRFEATERSSFTIM